MKEVKGIARMFVGCSSLTELPDISRWNTSNVINVAQIFDNCSSLLYLPDISKWNLTKAKDTENLLSENLYSEKYSSNMITPESNYSKIDSFNYLSSFKKDTDSNNEDIFNEVSSSYFDTKSFEDNSEFYDDFYN